MILPVSVFLVLFPSQYYEKPANHGGALETSVPLVEAIEDFKQNPRTSLEALKNSAHEQQKKKTFVQTFSILEKQALPVGTIMKNLFLNPSYILSVLAITNVMFILTALQYWVTSYGINVLKADQDLVVLTFSATVITAPCIGAITGGIVCTKALGSYTNPKALGLCFIVYCFFIGFCAPCPIVSNYWAFIGLVWGAIFMQGFIEPIMMGIILNTVTPIERPTASSFSILIEFIVGLLPANYVYGFIQDKYAVYEDENKEKNISRAGMYTVFFSSAIGGVCLLIALVLRSYSYKKGAQRMKASLKQSMKHITEEQIDEVFEAIVADNK
jgi:MFS family permease